MYIELEMPSKHLPSIFPSIRDFSNKSALHIRWPKYWSFSFNINSSNEYSELISFKIDWCDLLPVQGTLRSLLQQHSLKASILWCSAFFVVQLLQPDVTTEKTIALTIQTFVGRVMSLLFNTLSRLVIAFLPKAIIFWIHGCSHCPQWFWSPRRGNRWLTGGFKFQVQLLVFCTIATPSIYRITRVPLIFSEYWNSLKTHRTAESSSTTHRSATALPKW